MAIKDDIQKKSLAGVHKYVWALAGTFSVITLTLMFNGINAGQHINELIDIHIEERRQKLLNNKLECRFLKIESEVKNNTDLSHRAHKP